MSVTPERWPATAAALSRTLGEGANRHALATVIAVEGSAYRRPGAKMLIGPDGETTGALTAGCLRERIVEAALAALESAESHSVTFDLDDGETWDLATGCDGRIKVLVEPVDPPIRRALEMAADRRPVTIYTAVESTTPSVAVGDRRIEVDPRAAEAGGAGFDDREAHGDRETMGSLPETVVPTTESGATSRTRQIETDEGRVTVFVDHIEPAPRLVLFGSRPDLRPIAHLGRAVGFEVVVASPRGGSATDDAFPSADEVVACHPSDLPEHVDAWSYPVLLSHNLVDDRLALSAVLDETQVPYVGLLGSRDRARRLLDAVEDELGPLSGAQLDRVSTPVGLDLGGDGPLAVALSIVSEVFAVHHGGSGGRLCEQTGPIHDRP